MHHTLLILRLCLCVFQNVLNQFSRDLYFFGFVDFFSFLFLFAFLPIILVLFCQQFFSQGYRFQQQNANIFVFSFVNDRVVDGAAVRVLV